MLSLISRLFFTNRFYFVLTVIILIFILAGFFPFLYLFSITVFFLFVGWLLFETIILFNIKEGIDGKRNAPDKLSNGDDNDIFIDLRNRYRHNVQLKVIDEVPPQFQLRNIDWTLSIKPKESKTLLYKLKPLKRGEYDFGAVNIYASVFFKLVERRYQFDNHTVIPVYPSFLQLKRYELAAFSNKLEELGIKKQRRIGHTMEFEQIKNYVIGDDPRSINWKATARAQDLMINRYQEEKAQQVYAIIDKGRLMKMPFDGLSLLDYSINASLVILNIALKKEDKPGLITFSNKMSSVVKAAKKPGQMNRILEALYNQRTKYLESNYSLMTSFVRRRIRQRSLLLLFTNFESIHSFERQKSYFKTLATRHVLIVVFFKNTGLGELRSKDAFSIEGIYQQTIAEMFVHEKQIMVKQLSKLGIYSILTTPKDLTINTINKYLELKNRGVV